MKAGTLRRSVSPIQGIALSRVGSHYHFFEVNPALTFDRQPTLGFRLNIPAGTAIRFEPGQNRQVELVRYAGKQRIFGFRGDVMGDVDQPDTTGGSDQ